jgi:SSS family transporter
MGKAGKAYEVGIGIFFASIAYSVGLYLFSYLAPVLKRVGIWSVPRALTLRYGHSFTYLAAGIVMLATIGIFGVQLIAFGLVVVTILPDAGITYEQAVVASAIIMVVYTALGGLLAVAYTDVVQTVIMVLAIGLLLPFLVVSDIGGPGAAIERLAPPGGDWLGGMTIAYFLAIFLVDVPFSLLDNSLWQRTGASRNVSHIQRGVRMTSYMFLAWSLVATTLGVWAVSLVPDLDTTAAGADAAIPMLVIDYMPPLIKGLCLAALLAVIMSTADTVLLIAGTTSAWDIAAALRPTLTDQQKMRIARVTVFVAGAIGTIFALTVRGLFDVLLLAFAVYVSTLFIPTMAALFWRRATRRGAIVSTIASFITLSTLYGLRLSGQPAGPIEPITASIAVSLVVMVGVSLTGDDGSSSPPLVSRSGAGSVE